MQQKVQNIVKLTQNDFHRLCVHLALLLQSKRRHKYDDPVNGRK